MKARMVLGLIVAMAVWAVLLTGSAVAAPTLGSIFSFSRVEADPQKDYQLTEQQGPWMILAATFSGEGADDQARELVLELRRRYKLPAYVYKKRFEFGDDANGRGVNQFGQPNRWVYRSGSEIEEIAVLVGEFDSVDAAEAKETLKEIKYARPEALDLKKKKHTNQNLASLREIYKAKLEEGAKKKKGSMGQAFLVRNPLHEGPVASTGVEPFVAKMNEGVEHSLLDCPGKFTVQVAHFAGAVVVDQGEISKIRRGEKALTDSQLHEAAEKANRLTEILRRKGWEAYEFHDRHSSIVTVGGFDYVGTPRADGKIEIHPEIFRIIETFKGVPITPGGLVSPKRIDGIHLDVQPLPVEVPKRSFGASQARAPLRGLW
ncbi:MAG TPA: hypothetical protein DD670_07055 [Planctomycetaceae bacterium]|nr:hypothetical protein [Planctomycetaceae bacterium]